MRFCTPSADILEEEIMPQFYSGVYLAHSEEQIRWNQTGSNNGYSDYVDVTNGKLYKVTDLTLCDTVEAYKRHCAGPHTSYEHSHCGENVKLTGPFNDRNLLCLRKSDCTWTIDDNDLLCQAEIRKLSPEEIKHVCAARAKLHSDPPENFRPKDPGLNAYRPKTIKNVFSSLFQKNND